MSVFVPQMLISQMLQVNVDARFAAEEVLSHPWVTVRHTPSDEETKGVCVCACE